MGRQAVARLGLMMGLALSSVASAAEASDTSDTSDTSETSDTSDTSDSEEAPGISVATRAGEGGGCEPESAKGLALILFVPLVFFLGGRRRQEG